ncbi:hypothetical protein KAR91_69160 [Candidatus Pacearchaeota archaeon]|nr:hypothetical protein [Candidatus Pacearchaeota archaeon]
MFERGQVRNEDRNKQTIDYSGLRYKKITPTDIDGKLHFFEIKRQIFIFIELKWGDAKCEGGQRWAFQNLVDVIPVPAIYIIAEHQIEDTGQPVMGHLCRVREYRSNDEWHSPPKHVTLKYVIDKFLNAHGFQDYIKYVP